MKQIAEQMQFRKFRIHRFFRIYSSSFRDSLSKHVSCCCHKYSTFPNNSNPESLQKARSRSPQNDDELSHIISSNKKITSHIRSGNIYSAMEVFNNMNAKTTVTWNSILAGLANLPGKVKEARELFDKIPEPDSVSYNSMLACYLKNAAVEEAKAFFQMIPVKDVASWNTMISGLFRTARIDEAEELFHIMPGRNIVTWNVMISGYVEAGVMESALKLFEMAPSKSVVAWTSLISGYMRSGNVDLAEKTFEEMPNKNLVTLNAMMAGYVENGRGETALKLFKNMLELGNIGPNQSTLSSVLLACSTLSLLKFGKQVHQLTCKSPLCIDTTVGNSLISMYSKCGVLNDSHRLFTDMPCKDVTTYNAMISGYAQHGESEKALDLFDEMASNGSMIKPDWITFVGVLSACNHAGLVDLGIHYFERMQRDYEIKPKPDHYTCMIDLLGRAGKLNDAMDMIEKMPCKPHAALYGTLLGACRTHKNVEIAELAARKLLGIDSCNPAAYVQLANVYASKKKWEKVSEIRRSMKQNKVVKTPGISWIEVKGTIHEFRSRDRLHPELKCIHEKLDELEKKLKLAGYVPVLESSLHDVADEQKQELLLCHSEKLAIAFGLMKLPLDIPIRVFKNLRVCEDCHEATKFISALEVRELVVRDTTRFHHFKGGRCSCGDYW